MPIRVSAEVADDKVASQNPIQTQLARAPRNMVAIGETAVQPKKLHGIHEPTMKIRAPIKTLKEHSSMLSVSAPCAT